MKSNQNLRIRLSLQTAVLDYIHSQDWRDHDRFAAFLVEKLLASAPANDDSIRDVIEKLSHPFFRYNSISARRFAAGFPVTSVAKIIRSHPELDSRFVQLAYPRMRGVNPAAKRIYVDELDSFSAIRDIPRSSVANKIPLNISERSIKEVLCEKLGVNPIPRDWGGERSDLFADVIFNGRRIPTAFLLKGNGTRGQLTIAKCGKNGDQIVRLVEEPARLFVVQHVDSIDSNVVKALEMAVNSIARRTSGQMYYCVVDGVETARLLKAYGTLPV